ARLECAHAVAAREISLLVEHAVGRQIDFAMDVAHLAAIEVDRRIVKPVVRPFFDEAGNKGGVAAQFFKTADLACGERGRDVRHHVAVEMSGTAQLRKEQEIGAPLRREANLLLVDRKIGSDTSQAGIYLRDSASKRPISPSKRLTQGVNACTLAMKDRELRLRKRQRL